MAAFLVVAQVASPLQSARPTWDPSHQPTTVSVESRPKSQTAVVSTEEVVAVVQAVPSIDLTTLEKQKHPKWQTDQRLAWAAALAEDHH